MKFLAMLITNQKLSFDIFTVENLLNILMEHDLIVIFVIKINRKFWPKQFIVGLYIPA